MQAKIFEEFFSYSYPSEYVSYRVFEDVLRAHSLDTGKLKEYFNSFDASIKGSLTFLDYLLGISTFY